MAECIQLETGERSTSSPTVVVGVAYGYFEYLCSPRLKYQALAVKDF